MKYHELHKINTVHFTPYLLKSIEQISKHYSTLRANKKLFKHSVLKLNDSALYCFCT